MQAWQPDTLAEAFGDRLFKATKPFLTGGECNPALPASDLPPATCV